MIKALKMFFFYFLQFTWGLPQNIIGFFMMIKYKRFKKEVYHGSIITYHNEDWGGISLGVFIILNGTKDEHWTRNMKVHEYGHTVQSLISGPFYLFIVGIPSFIWCHAKKYIKLREEKGVSYFSVYPENLANSLGAAVTKEKWNYD